MEGDTDYRPQREGPSPTEYRPQHEGPTNDNSLPQRQMPRGSEGGRRWIYLTTVVLLLSGVVMAYIALFLPPPGEIHDSVLYIFAQILIYAGSIFGFGAYIRQDDDKGHRGPVDHHSGAPPHLR